MTASAALAVRSWPVGKRTVTLTIQRPESQQPVNAVIEWTPTLPSRLSNAELREYRRGRNAALASLTFELGGPIAVVEL